MCGNHFGRFAGPSVRQIFFERDENLAILDNLGSYTFSEIPPYAALDTTEAGYLETGIVIDPLANDFDGNHRHRSQ
jgi:hypothetical protein